MLKVVLLGLAVDEDVIKIDHKELSNVRMEDLCHEVHKGAWGIWEPEWHDKPLIQPIFGFKGHLPLISGPDSDLVVATFEVYLWKDGGYCEHIQHIIKSRDWKSILDSDFTDGAIVYTHSSGAIFLGCEKGEYGTWAFAHLDEALSHKFFNLPPELSMLNGVEAVMGKVG